MPVPIQTPRTFATSWATPAIHSPQTHVHVVPEGDRHAEMIFQRRAQIDPIHPTAEVGHGQDLTMVDDTGNADAHGDRCVPQRLDQLDDGRDDRIGPVDGCGCLRSIDDPVIRVDDAHLDIGPADIDACDDHDGFTPSTVEASLRASTLLCQRLQISARCDGWRDVDGFDARQPWSAPR